MQHGGTTTRAAGVDVSSSDTSKIPAALQLVSAADATVLVLGITRSQEHEGIDRSNTLLPGQQTNFAKQVLAAAKGPVVVVLVSGGIVSIDELVAPAPAIVDTFNPAQQGPAALAMSLFGLENRWGKLPVTIYPGDYSAMQKIQEMSLTSGPGRSYRYYNGTPLFTFGHGLSYTDFSLACKQQPDDEAPAAPASRARGAAAADFSFACAVANTGTVAGDEVVQAFHSVSPAIKAKANHPVPIRRLVEFGRVSLDKGASASVAFTLAKQQLALTVRAAPRRVYRRCAPPRPAV